MVGFTESWDNFQISRGKKTSDEHWRIDNNYIINLSCAQGFPPFFRFSWALESGLLFEKNKSFAWAADEFYAA